MKNISKLRDYQKNAVKFVIEKKKCALFIDMGLGKTLITLRALELLKKKNMFNRCLVVGPKEPVEHTWPSEIKKWDIKLTTSKASGGKHNRTLAYKQKTDIMLINKDTLKDLCQPFVEKKMYDKWPFDVVIIDESSCLKNPSTMRFLALKKIIDNANINYTVLLSGTPSPNSLIDLWAQIYTLDGGLRLQKTYQKFLHHHCRMLNPQYHTYYVPKDDRIKIKNAIEDIVLRIKCSDKIELPEKVVTDIVLEFPPAIRKKYDRLEKDLVYELADTNNLVWGHVATMLGKLRQMCNGFIYTGMDDSPIKLLHQLKINALRDMYENNPTENFIVAYSYKFDLKVLKHAFPEAVWIKEPGAIDKWNSGKVRMLLAHPASAGHGLNLQYGGRNMVWYGPIWSLEYYLQTNARLHRSGQKQAVNIYHLLIKDSIEIEILKRLTSKDAVQTSLLDSLREWYL